MSGPASLHDDFRFLDDTKWQADPGVSAGNGVLTILVPPGSDDYAGVFSVQQFDLHDCEATVHIRTPSNDDDFAAYFDLGYRNSFLEFFQSGGGLSLIAKDETDPDGGADSYMLFVRDDSSWWRIQEQGGLVHWWTAPDGGPWTKRWSYPTPPWAATVGFALGAHAVNDNPGTSRVEFESLNGSP